jgi:hypothetical protein
MVCIIVLRALYMLGMDHVAAYFFRHIFTMKFSLFLFVLLAGFGSPAHADQIMPINDARPLIEWVEARTNTMLLPRPKIFVSSEALLRLTSAEGATTGSERIAAYRNGVIIISEKYWAAGDIADQSVLIHELVHDAQDLGGRRYECTGQREQEAYRLQNAFLIEHGQRAYIERDVLEHMGQCSGTSSAAIAQ